MIESTDPQKETLAYEMACAYLVSILDQCPRDLQKNWKPEKSCLTHCVNQAAECWRQFFLDKAAKNEHVF